MRSIGNFSRPSTHSNFRIGHVNGDGIIYRTTPASLEIYTPDLKLKRSIFTGKHAGCICDDVDLAYTVGSTLYTTYPIVEFVNTICGLIYHPYRKSYVVSTKRNDILIYNGAITGMSQGPIAGMSQGPITRAITGEAIISYHPVASSYSPNIYFIDQSRSSLEISNGKELLTSGQLLISHPTTPVDPWMMYLTSTPGTPDGLTVMTAGEIAHIDLWHASMHTQSTVCDKSLLLAGHTFWGMSYINPNVIAAISSDDHKSTINLCDIRYRTSRRISISDNGCGATYSIWYAAPDGISTLYVSAGNSLVRFM